MDKLEKENEKLTRKVAELDKQLVHAWLVPLLRIIAACDTHALNALLF